MLDPSLLPLNSTPFEDAVEAALTLDCPVATGDLWNAATCPAPLLSWLAWALSVDIWDPSWPEAVQRNVIAASPAVHREKGTKKSLIDALEAVRVRATLTEWFEAGGSGDPGTFVVRAFARSRYALGQPVLSPDVIATIRAIIAATAPVSRHWTLELGVESAINLGVAVSPPRGLRIARKDVATALPALRAAMAVAACARVMRVHYMDMRLVA